MNTKKPTKPTASTQAYLDIEEIREDVVILKDGSMRAIILVSSINFDLKSEDERNAILQSFQNFLNSLSFPLQIMIDSKKIDLDDYLKMIEAKKNSQKNELLKIQISEYIDYIKGLLDQVNIMDKRFFVIVPFYPNVMEKSGILDKIPLMNKKQNPKGTSNFENDKVQLMDRVDVVVGGLKSVGLNCASLDTQNLIELFYSLYNPHNSKTQKMRNPSDMSSDIVHKGEGSGPVELEV